jgi:hypothetical protein
MGQGLMIATRKGLFALDAEGVIQQRSFLGEPVTAVARDSADGTLYAALNLGHFGCKMHRSEDDGATWTEVAAPSYAGVSGDPPPSLFLIWTLEVRDGVLWAGTIPGGLFRSDDRGANWILNRPLWDDPLRADWFGGGYDDAGLHSISFDPRDPQRLAIGVSCGGAWLTEDGGASWRVSTEGMFADYMPPEARENPATQDPHRLARCTAQPDTIWVQHHNGVFKSEDAGNTWREIKINPSSFGFAVAAHPKDPDTAWFAPATSDQQRQPVDGRFVVTRTRDGGRTFETLTRGLPAGESYDLIYRHGLEVDETGARLAMGSTTGNLWLSDDGGDAWQLASAHLPPIYAVRWV